MKLNYYLLWVEDDDSWFKDTSELFEMTIKDFGFDAIIERKKTLLEVKEEIAKDNGIIFKVQISASNTTTLTLFYNLAHKVCYQAITALLLHYMPTSSAITNNTTASF